MRLLLLLLLFLLPGQAAAQDFHRYYDLAGSDALRDLLVLAPNRLVGIGISEEDDLESTSLLMLNGMGEVLNAKTLSFPTRTRGMALARQTDSTFWMGVWQTPVGIIDDWAVYRVNANTGQVIASFGWGEPNTDEQIRAMAPTPDGGVIVVGNTGDNNEAIISRLAEDGTELFRRGFAIPGNRFTIFTDVEVLPGGDILAAGGFRPSDDGTPSGYCLARIDPAGNLVWSQRYDLGGALSADGAGLQVELLDQDMIALVGTGVVDETRMALALLVDANGEVASAFRGDPGTSARDALSVAGETLLIAGTLVQGDPALLSGMVTRFDLMGNGVPQTTLVNNPVGRNSLTGIRRRPGGGYYLFGRGRLCTDDAEDDALLLSTNDNIVNDLANCQTTTFPALGLRFSVTASAVGELFDRTDPRFAPAGFAERPWTVRDQVCPRLEVTFADLPDPLCYQDPVKLIETAVSLIPEDQLTSIRIALRGGDPGEFLTLDASTSAVRIVTNGTDFILDANGPGGGTEIMTLLRSLRYAAGPGVTASGVRTIRLMALGECIAGPIVSFDFNVIVDGNPLAGLPIDTVLCPGNDLVLSIPNIPGTTINWSTGATSPGLTISNPGTYGLTVTNECRVDSATIIVEERETETLQANNITLFACLGGDSLSFTAVPEADVGYRWADGPVGPTRIFRQSGTYELVRTNPCSEAITTVFVNFQDCCQLYVPSAFSPNGDGINDVFRAFPDTGNCQQVIEFQLRVFDRWGGEVYAGSGLTDGWDGRVGEDAAGNGHFVYSMSYFNGLETVRRSGGLVLLR